MNKDLLAGKWKQLKGKIKEEWNELTDDELDAVAGRTEQIADIVQERYGIEQERAKERPEELAKDC